MGKVYSKRKLRILLFIPVVVIFIPLLYLAIIKLIPDTSKVLVLFISALATIGSTAFYLSFVFKKKDIFISRKELLNEVILFILVLVLAVFVFWFRYLK